MIKKGDEISVNITGQNSEGKGISKLEDGFVVFSDNTLPGDRALIKIRKKKTSYAEASLVSIENPSEYRINPECSHFGVCGGCKMQNYDYGRQLIFKTGVVKNAFERIGGFKDLNILDTVRSEKIFFYRNKMEFSFSDDVWVEEKDLGKEKEKFALGLHVPKFHSKITDITKCLLQSELSNGILNFTRDFFKERNIPVYSTKTHSGFLRFLIVRNSEYTKEVMVNLITHSYDEKLINEYSLSLKKNFSEITTIINSTSEKKAQIAFGDRHYILEGKGFITEMLSDAAGKKFEFRISPQSFFQTNTLQAEKLFNALIMLGEFSKSDNVLDLYCGTGSITILVSEFVNKIKGAEIYTESVKDALRNAELNGISNAEFVCSDIREFTENKDNITGYNKLILDPPRSGLHPKICDILSETKFGKILYVSCNPHTQARDIQIICGKGNYKIKAMMPFDLFPHTYHVENIVCLEKND